MKSRRHAKPLRLVRCLAAVALIGRLRRESWLVSKRRRYLNLHLGLYMAWRNWVRPRFNRDVLTPAELSGVATRALRPSELVGWRQDWGQRSVCPLGPLGPLRGVAA